MDCKITRKTTESQISVGLTFGGLEPGYRQWIRTPVPFLSHMIEHIAWRANVNIDVSVELGEFFLHHVLYEDLGTTMGRAFMEYIHRNKQNGVIGYADEVGIIDEAKAECAVSFEDRTYHSFHSSVPLPPQTEGVNSEDLITFLDGFVQGARCTLHVDIDRGENGHHIWEAVFRALGAALGRACSCDPARAGMTAGVAGSIEYIVE